MPIRRFGSVHLGLGRRRRRVHRRRGGNIFADIGNALSSAHHFIRKNKVISTVGNALGAVGVPYASAIGKAAGVLGYGRRRRVYRRRRGGDLKSTLASAHKFIKDRRLISSALKHFGHHRLSAASAALGYGRRRRTVRQRRGGALPSLASVHKFVKDRRLVSHALRHFLPNSNLHKAAHTLGYGRRRTVIRRAVRHRGGANFFSTEQIAVPKF